MLNSQVSLFYFTHLCTTLRLYLGSIIKLNLRLSAKLYSNKIFAYFLIGYSQKYGTLGIDEVSEEELAIYHFACAN